MVRTDPYAIFSFAEERLEKSLVPISALLGRISWLGNSVPSSITRTCRKIQSRVNIRKEVKSALQVKILSEIYLF
jgi:hypothetical protein